MLSERGGRVSPAAFDFGNEGRMSAGEFGELDLSEAAALAEGFELATDLLVERNDFEWRCSLWYGVPKS